MYIHVIVLKSRVDLRGWGEEATTTPFSLKIILHHFYRQIKGIIMYSWQVYRPPLSQFSG